jgi:hypothetical protein
MEVYGLFARRHWPERAALQLKGVTVYLVEYGTKVHDLTADRLAAAQAEAENSIHCLQNLLSDQVANLAGIDRFPMINDLAVCHRCRFRETCDRR